MRTKQTTWILLCALAACGGAPPQARDAEQRLLAGNLAGAQALVDSGLRDHPREPLFWNVRIRVQLGQRNNAQAVATYEEFRALVGQDDPGSLRAMALTTLWQALASESPEARQAAILVAERLDEVHLFDDVTKLLGDDDELVRTAAAIAAVHSHPDAPRVLTASLSSDSPKVRALAVEGLGRKVGKLAIADIRRALGDPDAEVRDAAVMALAKVTKGGDDVATLVRLVGEDKAGSVRSAALRALAKLRPRSEPALAVAKSALDAPDLATRLAAVDALLALGGKAALPPVPSVTMTGAPLPVDDVIVGLRIASLRKDDAVAGLSLVTVALNDTTDWTVRAAGLNSIAEILPSEAAANMVRKLTADPETGVSLAAARALARLGHVDEAIAVWTATVDATALAEAFRLDAGIELMRRGNPKGEPVVAELAANGAKVHLRKQAITALGGKGSPKKALLLGLADDAVIVRVAAAEEILLGLK